MMKLKKIIAAAASVVMACVFATSAFAANVANPAEAKRKAAEQFPAYAEVINGLTDAQVNAVAAAPGSFDNAVTVAKNYQNAIKANPADAAAKVAEALATVPSLNIDVSEVKVATAADGTVTVSAKVVNNDPGSTAYNQVKSVSSVVVAAYDAHPEIGEAIKNGTWGVDEKKASTAAAVTSAAAGKGVIKATGDNAAVVLVMVALDIVGVLGLAVRTNGAEA